MIIENQIAAKQLCKLRKPRCSPPAISHYLSLFILLLAACNQPGTVKEKDTSTSGSIAIAADYEYKPVTEAEIEVFQALYHNAKIRPIFTTEDSAFRLLLKDSVRLVITSRKLLPSEESTFHSLKLYPEQMKVATDAVALIVNKDNTDTLFTIGRLRAIFGGKDSLWKKAANKNYPRQRNRIDTLQGTITVVFDYENSSNSHYIIQNLIHGGKLPHYCYTLHGNAEVMHYVSKNKNAIGIIGVNQISNVYDTDVIKCMKDITVIAVSNKEDALSGDYFKPYAENIQYGAYPLVRSIYIVSREAYTGLGSGFFSFVTSNRGQRIIYRDGLAPITELSHNISF